MKRRVFFKSIMQAIAIVALAPQIAFRVPMRKISIEPSWELHQIEMKFCKPPSAPDFYTWLMITSPQMKQPKEVLFWILSTDHSSFGRFMFQIYFYVACIWVAIMGVGFLLHLIRHHQ